LLDVASRTAIRASDRAFGAIRTNRCRFVAVTEVDENLDMNDGPSCSALAALERQEPFVNAVLAQHALALLARLFRYGRIEHHGAFVHVAGNRVQPIPCDPVVWRKMCQLNRRVG